MKTICKFLVVGIFILNATPALSQDPVASDSSLRFGSLKVGGLGFTGLDDTDLGGVQVNSSVGLISGKNIYTISLLHGEGFLNNSRYTEIAALWGRELAANSWMGFEYQVGLGYVSYREGRFLDGNPLRESEHTIGLPTKVKLRFGNLNGLSAGLENGFTFTPDNVVYNVGFFVQFNFN